MRNLWQEPGRALRGRAVFGILQFKMRRAANGRGANGDRKMKHLKIAIAALCAVCPSTAALCAGQTGGLPEKPVRIGVYVDKGARNIGAYRWIEIAQRTKNAVATCVDGKAVRDGALDSLDLLVMPGGKASLEAASLGGEGRRKLKAFIENGGGYVGTCAGCFLLMQPGAGVRKNYLGLIPYKCAPSGGHADIEIRFNGNAERLAGLADGTVQRVRYAGGPVLVRDPSAGDSKIETVATYHSELDESNPSPRKPFRGKGAAAAGDCGKGRIFVFAVHPESDRDDHFLLRKAFEYVLRRKVEWDYPVRREGALSAGFVCDDSFGAETGRLVQKLVSQDEFNIVPVNKKEAGKGALERIDALLVPDCAGSDGSDMCLGKENAKAVRRFAKRGGLIVAWGAGAAKTRACGVKFEEAADGADALARLRRFAAERPSRKAE